MEIEIAPMQLADLEQIKDSLLEEFDDFWTFTMLKQELENKNNLNSTYFVVKGNEEIVGFAGIVKIVDEIDIMNIVVKKSKRKLGIGSALLQKIIEFSKEQKATSITLEVNYKNNPAIALYQKFLFIQVGVRSHYYQGEDAILMVKNL